MTRDGKEAAVKAAHETIASFIFGTARLEHDVSELLRLMGTPDRHDIELTANAREAEAVFGTLALDDSTKAGFATLMQSVAALGEQQDDVAARFTEISEGELAARVKEIGAATDQLKHFHAIVEKLAPAGGG
jgi:hypothetical protein